MRISRSFVIPAITVLIAISQTALATNIAYEGFAPSFPVYANGGTGFKGPWLGDATPNFTVTENSLCFDDLQTSSNSISLSADPLNIASLYRPLAKSLGADNTVAYLSFLLTPKTINSGWFGIVFGGSMGTSFIGKPGAGTPEQYVIETITGPGQVSSGTPTVVGKTALLVVKAEFLPGTDKLTLYVNPLPNGFEPVGTVIKTDLDLGIISSLGIFSADSGYALDEIRIGTTYPDVVPVINKHHNQCERR